MVFKCLLIIVLLLNVSDILSQSIHKVYKTKIIFMDGKKSSGKLIFVKDSSLVIVTSKNDTINVLATNIKKLKIKRRFKHGQTFGITMAATAIVTGIITYSTYQDPTTGYVNFGRNTSSILSGILGGIYPGGPFAGMIIGLKELSKKKYHINGSQLKYGYLKPYLKKYYNN